MSVQLEWESLKRSFDFSWTTLKHSHNVKVYQCSFIGIGRSCGSNEVSRKSQDDLKSYGRGYFGYKRLISFCN